MTHQELLDAFVRARLSVIYETSTTSEMERGALEELIARAESYAAVNGLTTTCLDETRARTSRRWTHD